MSITISISQAQAAIEAIVKAKKVPIIKGPPGTGKTWCARAFAEKFRLKLIDLRLAQCEPPDINGFPALDAAGNKSTYFPMDTFPLEGDKVPEGYDGWMIFFDEFTSCGPEMQAASYKVILDRMIGQHKLHPKAVMIAAGNNIEDSAIVHEMSSALVSRFVHLNVRSDFKEFRKVALELGLDHRIRSYLEFKPNSLNNFDPEKLSIDSTYACERTWHFLSDIMVNTPPEDPLALCIYAGTVGEGVAREFIGFCKVYHNLPRISEIVKAPEQVEIPREPGTLYALTGALAENADKDNIDALMRFIKRMPLDFQVVTLRQIIFQDRSMMHDVQAISNWIDDTSADLF